MEVRIQKLFALNQGIYRQIVALLPQLSENIEIQPYSYFDDIVNSMGTHIFCAFNGYQLIGTATLVIYKIPSGIGALIEDFVVNEKYRGLGVGKKIIQHLIDYCGEKGIKYINLTSNPQRIAANKLYQSLGFKQKETSLYYLELE